MEQKGVQTSDAVCRKPDKAPLLDEMRKSGEGYRVAEILKIRTAFSGDTFWVGVYPGMTDEMIDYMAKTIREAIGR